MKKSIKRDLCLTFAVIILLCANCACVYFLYTKNNINQIKNAIIILISITATLAIFFFTILFLSIINRCARFLKVKFNSQSSDKQKNIEQINEEESESFLDQQINPENSVTIYRRSLAQLKIIRCEDSGSNSLDGTFENVVNKATGIFDGLLYNAMSGISAIKKSGVLNFGRKPANTNDSAKSIKSENSTSNSKSDCIVVEDKETNLNQEDIKKNICIEKWNILKASLHKSNKKGFLQQNCQYQLTDDGLKKLLNFLEKNCNAECIETAEIRNYVLTQEYDAKNKKTILSCLLDDIAVLYHKYCGNENFTQKIYNELINDKRYQLLLKCIQYFTGKIREKSSQFFSFLNTNNVYLGIVFSQCKFENYEYLLCIDKFGYLIYHSYLVNVDCKIAIERYKFISETTLLIINNYGQNDDDAMKFYKASMLCYKYDLLYDKYQACFKYLDKREYNQLMLTYEEFLCLLEKSKHGIHQCYGITDEGKLDRNKLSSIPNEEEIYAGNLYKYEEKICTFFDLLDILKEKDKKENHEENGSDALSESSSFSQLSDNGQNDGDDTSLIAELSDITHEENALDVLKPSSFSQSSDNGQSTNVSNAHLILQDSILINI